MTDLEFPHHFFQVSEPQDAIAPLRQTLIDKGRTIGGQSRFALLNVGDAKAAAKEYVPISIVMDALEDDPSHALVTGYDAYNDQVAEELAKVVIDSFPAKA